MNDKKKPLGRGLFSLISEETLPINYDNSLVTIELSKIEPNPSQPRKFFDQKSLVELSNSIKHHGVLQPIVVSNVSYDKFQILAGERRYRASKLAGLKNIPAIINNTDVSSNNKKAFEVALIENIQRENLSLIEEANSYTRLLKEFGYSHNEIGKIVGKSRSHISNIIRLLQLPKEVQELISTEKISQGHARCLILSKNPEELALRTIKENLTVRQLEALTKEEKERTKNIEQIDQTEKSNHLVDPIPKENELEDLLNTLKKKFSQKITIEKNKSSGKISFHFKNLLELDELFMKFTSS